MAPTRELSFLRNNLLKKSPLFFPYAILYLAYYVDQPLVVFHRAKRCKSQYGISTSAAKFGLVKHYWTPSGIFRTTEEISHAGNTANYAWSSRSRRHSESISWSPITYRFSSAPRFMQKIESIPIEKKNTFALLELWWRLFLSYVAAIRDSKDNTFPFVSHCMRNCNLNGIRVTCKPK